MHTNDKITAQIQSTEALISGLIQQDSSLLINLQGTIEHDFYNLELIYNLEASGR